MNITEIVSNSSAIMSLITGAIETTRTLSDLWKSDKSASVIQDLNKKLLDLHFKCAVQSEHVVSANKRVSEAEKEIGELEKKIEKMTSEKAVLDKFHPVRVCGLFSVCVPKEPVDAMYKEQMLCAQCFCRYKIGVLNEIGNGRLEVGRGPDAVVKCGTCGAETKVLRRAFEALFKRP